MPLPTAQVWTEDSLQTPYKSNVSFLQDVGLEELHEYEHDFGHNSGFSSDSCSDVPSQSSDTSTREVGMRNKFNESR